jgi:hypothetical protein
MLLDPQLTRHGFVDGVQGRYQRAGAILLVICVSWVVNAVGFFLGWAMHQSFMPPFGGGYMNIVTALIILWSGIFILAFPYVVNSVNYRIDPMSRRA